jgi:hypothetical protein
VDYELTERARELLPVIGALARWGYQWTWTAPRPDEAIDIGAILRSAVGLPFPGGLEGAIELTVVRPDGQLKRYTVELGGGAMSVQERSAPGARARIRGHESAWVEALGPGGSRGGLDITGDTNLARGLLECLSPIPMRVAAAG